jgi:DNA polymerase III delta subunit
MVREGNRVYLFIGQDSASKDLRLSSLKETFLTKETKEFNSDTLYGQELTLKSLQEILSYLPLDSSGRLVVIKNAQDLKENIKDFLIRYAEHPHPKILLILDIDRYDSKDSFMTRIFKNAQVCRFKEEKSLTTFDLSRQIELRKADSSLKILNKLLKEGEKPERILGGLRFNWEKYVSDPAELRKRLKALLNCDIEIKTGKLKPAFALEKFVLNVCSLKGSFS